MSHVLLLLLNNKEISRFVRIVKKIPQTRNNAEAKWLGGSKEYIQ